MDPVVPHPTHEIVGNAVAMERIMASLEKDAALVRASQSLLAETRRALQIATLTLDSADKLIHHNRLTVGSRQEAGVVGSRVFPVALRLKQLPLATDH